MRKLLEVTHEAFVDSGIDYKALRGSPRVGVYLGCCGSEVHAMWLSDYNNITGYEQTGCTLSMFANRLSFFFDFKGPSKAVDTGGGAGRIPELACITPTKHVQCSSLASAVFCGVAEVSTQGELDCRVKAEHTLLLSLSGMLPRLIFCSCCS